METVQVNVTFDQIKQALRKLPAQEKMALWRLLDADLDRAAIAKKFASAVNSIRKTYSKVSESQAMYDAVKATREVRKARHGKSRS
ncbi:MAG: hypothetical protein AB1607_06740 [Chloroflexota bacterium]